MGQETGVRGGLSTRQTIDSVEVQPENRTRDKSGDKDTYETVQTRTKGLDLS